MFILTINSKINSFKFNLFNMNSKQSVASGNVSGIGLDAGGYSIKFSGQKITHEVVVNSHVDAARMILDKIVALDIIKEVDDIKAIGHRVINGGEKYSSSVIINDEVIKDIEEFSIYVPLHQKANLLGIQAFREVVPNTTMVAVFDTAFYNNLDKEEYLYPVPYMWYKEYGIRKFGAHGIVHKHVTEKISKILEKDELRIISCHIGNGVSVSAVNNMTCIDTSMGFTPLTGAMMGTRSGDVDSSIIPFVMEKEGKNALEVIEDLNKKSGLLGMSEVSSDMRDILSECDNGNENAILAKNKYIRMIVDYIAKYYVLLGGCDVLTFTGGIGQNSSVIRSEICDKLSCLGVFIDDEKNSVNDSFQKISSDSSSFDVYVVPKKEDLFIANEVLDLIENR